MGTQFFCTLAASAARVSNRFEVRVVPLEERDVLDQARRWGHKTTAFDGDRRGAPVKHAYPFGNFTGRAPRESKIIPLWWAVRESNPRPTD